MGTRSETICDVCAKDGTSTPAREVHIGAWNKRQPLWYSLDLCEAHELALFGQLEGLLDIAGADVTGPKPGAK